MKKEDAYKRIESLVERFSEQYESYKSNAYNETSTRRDFIDPFFKALGWDVDNENGYAESYREVIHEDRLKVGNTTKAPDYSFQLVGGKALFFVEAKKPSINIKNDIPSAYQIRWYGWNARLAISILTDFEEFAVYDCTCKPLPSDSAAKARIRYLTFRDYLNEFDFIWQTFGKENVLKGSFDRYVQNDQHKKGTTTVDGEFLKSLDNWRTMLALSICRSNKQLTEDEINFIVQQTIDRIIFLRIAEDRSAEQYGNLQSSIKQGDYYQNLLHHFKIADQKYNSGLFDFQKDKISQRITIDNKVIKSIVSEFYYPLCPYEFSVLSVEILGSAYEQFLGKSISLSKSGRATIEEKPEVRKAGGVYYTPQYIVDYIVKHTVGKLIENKTPKEVSEIKICDPACGSGHFLIGAAHRLAKRLATVRSGEDEPSIASVQHALRDVVGRCLYGVDINPMAVELCKTSLWMDAMEPGRSLAFLDHRIKCGNSLLGTTPELIAEGIPDAAFTPIEGDDKAYCTRWKRTNREELTGQNQFAFDSETPFEMVLALDKKARSIDQLPNDTTKDYEKREKAYYSYRQSAEFIVEKNKADLWCGAFVWKKRNSPVTQSHRGCSSKRGKNFIFSVWR